MHGIPWQLQLAMLMSQGSEKRPELLTGTGIRKQLQDAVILADEAARSDLDVPDALGAEYVKHLCERLVLVQDRKG